LEEILQVKHENQEAVWTWWTVSTPTAYSGFIQADIQDERDREHWDEFQDTWAKRRRLIREKNELDLVPNKRRKSAHYEWRRRGES
jgi:hypothetical protein